VIARACWCTTSLLFLMLIHGWALRPCSLSAVFLETPRFADALIGARHEPYGPSHLQLRQKRCKGGLRLRQQGMHMLAQAVQVNQLSNTNFLACLGLRVSARLNKPRRRRHQHWTRSAVVAPYIEPLLARNLMHVTPAIY
jgi:hypothetical protein